MDHPLYLTADEQKLFQALPENLREDWKVESETQTFQDDDDRREVRFSSLKFENDGVNDILKSLQNAKTPTEVQAVFAGVNVDSITDDDMSELLFAMGPDGVSVLLDGSLHNAKTSDDVAAAGQLSLARHLLLQSLQNFAS